MAEAAVKLGQRDRLKDLDVWNKDIETYEYFEKLISGVQETSPSDDLPASDGTESGNAGGGRSGDPCLPGAGRGGFWVYAIVKPCFSRTVPSLPDRIHISCDDLKKELEMPESPYSVAHIAPLDKDGYGLVLRYGREDSLNHIAGTVRANLARIFSIRFHLAVSSPSDSPAVLGKLASEAVAALNFRFFRPAGSILFYEDYCSCKLNYSL